MHSKWMLALAGALAITAANAQTPPRGIFLDTGLLAIDPNTGSAKIPSYVSGAAQVTGVDGLVIVAPWSALENGNGTYNMAFLDPAISLAVRYNLKIELSIRADQVPSWAKIPGSGVSVMTLNIDNKGHPCSSVTYAVPWGSGFQSHWRALLSNAATYLKNKKPNIDGRNAYDDVVLLRVTGINMDSDELHMPPAKRKDKCTGHNIHAYRTAGYSSDQLQYAWHGIVDSFKAAFPDKYFSVAIIDSTTPFPDYGSNPRRSQNGSRNQSQEQNQPMLAIADGAMKGRLVIQNNSLYENVPAQPETVYFARHFSSLIAFQTNLLVKDPGRAACDKKGTTPCATPRDYLNLLNTGIYPARGMRANYIEVFGPDVAGTLSPAIAEAHDELFANPPPPPAPIKHGTPCPGGPHSCE